MRLTKTHRQIARARGHAPRLPDAGSIPAAADLVESSMPQLRHSQDRGIGATDCSSLCSRYSSRLGGICYLAFRSPRHHSRPHR